MRCWARSSSTTSVATRSRNARSWLATITGPAWPVTKSTISSSPGASRLLVGSSSRSTLVTAEQDRGQGGAGDLAPGEGAERPVRRDVEAQLGGDLGKPVLEVGAAQRQPR